MAGVSRIVRKDVLVFRKRDKNLQIIFCDPE